MSQRANKKISFVLTRLIDTYALGDTTSSSLQIALYDLTYDCKVQEPEVLLILENLKQHKLVLDWIQTVEDLILILDYNFLVNAQTYLSSLDTDFTQQINAIEEHFKIEEIQGKIKLTANGKTTTLSEDLKTKQAKLILALIDPSLGVYRTLESVAKTLGLEIIKGSDYKKPINNVFTEIQSKLNQIDFPVRLALDYKSHKGSVALIKKLGRS
jgi:hypothetical protein